MLNASVIVCTYNRCKSLAVTLESAANLVLSEDVKWEVVVVDNNSSDSTQDVVQRFGVRSPGRFRYVLEKNQGLSHARNRGIHEAQWQILAFTDDDVILDAWWLERLISALKVDLYAGAGGRILPDSTFDLPKWLSGETMRLGGVLPFFDCGPNLADLHQAPFGANMAYRRDAFEKYGYFRTDLGRKGKTLMSSEDAEFGRRLLSAGENLRYVPSAVVYHPVTEERMRKSYFQSWWFGLGRSSVLLYGRAPDVWGIPRPVLSIAKALVRIGVNGVRWLFAFRSDRRFFFKLQVWKLAGCILEFWRQLGLAEEQIGSKA